jgi:hypothetical protein
MVLTIKQTEVLDLLEDKVTNEILAGGAAGGAKSAIGCYWQLKQRNKYPGTRGFMGRARMKTLKDTTLKTFIEVATDKERYGLGFKRGVHFDITSAQDPESPGCIEFKNGSLIFLRDLFLYPSDPEFDDLGSLEITDAYIDECSQVSAKAREILGYRLRYGLDKWGLIPKILYTSNPVKGWLYDEFYKPSVDGKLDSNKAFVPMYVWDNPYAPREYVTMLENKPDGPEKQRLYYGNWDYAADPGVLCEYDAICDMFTNDHVQPDGKKRISADLAMQGRDRFVLGSWNGLVCTIRKDKEKSTGKSIETDVKEVMITDEVPHSQSVVDSDGMGAYLESYLKGIKEFHGGAQANNKLEFANLKSECGWKLAEKVNKREVKIICSKEQETRIKKEMTVLQSKDIDKDETRKRLIGKDEMKILLGGKSPDYLDMLLMGMYFHVKPQFVIAAA